MTDTGTALLRIVALSRRGALDHALRLFHAEGFADVQDDAAVLALKGRLLKDEALLASGATRRAKAAAAGDAYAASALIAPAPYPLINAATLALIAGDRAEAARRADEVLALMAREVADETAYWLAATEAEALLLKGEIATAKAALARAIEGAPLAWEDHASTLRQFAVILTQLGEDSAWLAPFLPPRSLYYTGQMAPLLPEEEIVRQVRQVVAVENVGFGFGSLAAGADIVVAECLLELGVELAVHLPLRVDPFTEVSVRPFGSHWVDRFRRTLAAASQTMILGDEGETGEAGLDSLVELADLVAMGRTVMSASMLQSEAVQLVVGETPGTGAPEGHSARAASLWRGAGRRQHIVASGRAVPGTADRADGVRLVSILAAEFGSPEGSRLAMLARAGGTLAAAAPVLADASLATPPRWSSSRLLLAWDDPADALRSAIALARAATAPTPMRLGLHIGPAVAIGSETVPALVGPAFQLAERVAEIADTGSIFASGPFAAALRAGSANCVRMEFIGELAGMTERDACELYVIRPSDDEFL
ncbi:MAG TPA: tetratricopeptide repeat-containing protein [Novosphingobium sp.]|nr:tetratricopeptide repeat-containing protein [Novosphingobium sp.]